MADRGFSAKRVNKKSIKTVLFEEAEPPLLAQNNLYLFTGGTFYSLVYFLTILLITLSYQFTKILKWQLTKTFWQIKVDDRWQLKSNDDSFSSNLSSFLFTFILLFFHPEFIVISFTSSLIKKATAVCCCIYDGYKYTKIGTYL